jgi:hypothetical protein
MSFLKSPYFPAVVCAIVIGIVIFMLFRDVSSVKSTMGDLVEQHNNAQKALETHSGAIKKLQETSSNPGSTGGPMSFPPQLFGGDGYGDEEDEEDYEDEEDDEGEEVPYSQMPQGAKALSKATKKES